ncbi:PTS system fructose-specific IIC component [Azospirillum fermentarium]|uniref:PTS fructose-like transporter subunit IIB n=1 Tax=Azospirillum fermentarium TaxID=1233114 RepID=UPI0022262DE6|nr:PTS fructose-like transporter subunit IIB [Azospirillum fermentarium]MCW2246044.1 PTS system fructose-specific IIC component [Azospirillum fermentarium]
MARLVAVTACPTGIAHTTMAAEALHRVARLRGHDIRIETRGADGVRHALSTQEIAAADAVILAADIAADEGRFSGKPLVRTSTAQAIRDTAAILVQAEKAAGIAPARAAAPQPAAPQPGTAKTAAPPLLVAVTACPTGIAHTFMAAEALTRAAKARGFQIRVETQGSVGAKNTLDPADIARADAVIIGADTHVDTARFAGKRLLQTGVGDALKHPDRVIDEALALPPPEAGNPPAASADYAADVARAKAKQKEAQAGPYKHLLTGVSFMLPLVVAGGLIIALSFVFGIEAFKQPGTFPAALMQIGGESAFALMVPVLAGYIAFSIADRPGLAPGLIGGMLAAKVGAGFLGGIAAGFLAGYAALWLRENIKLPANLEGLKPVLIIPLLATLAVGLLMIYVVGGPVAAVMAALTEFLKGMGTTNAVALGALLGAMMAFDMGGPVNKAAYTFGVGLLASDAHTPMAAVMAAGMTPPLGLALATVLVRNRFTEAEREAGKAAAVLGLAFITEGAIPFAAKDPLRVIPAMMVGSAVAGALSMWFGCVLHAPHGGVFVLAIPNAVAPLVPYMAAILAGTLVTTLGLAVLKKPLAAVAV